MAGSSVGVVDGIGLAQNGFAVEVDGCLVVFGTICLVAQRLELLCIVLSFLSKTY
jgi:hypothetical protein